MTSEKPSRLPETLIVLLVLGVGGYLAWDHFKPAPEPTPASAPVPPAAVPATPLPSAPAPAAPAIEHPVEPSTDTAVAQPMPALAEADAYVRDALVGLLGRDAVLTWLLTEGFVRRAVATVDNLPRELAPVMVWPIKPTPQRFTTLRSADGTSETIHPDNAARYTPFVRFVEAVDSAQAVALYRRLYPLFQQAYEELGFPGRYFNDRLVQVLDHLIATPVQPGPLAVKLVEVKGPVPSTRPWVRYEFTDPALESLSAGQKMLLRMGADNHQRLRAKLVDLRARVARR
ncbi:MAG: DUF3014 domain-containing protein [Hydrogenophaga sp.]